MSVVEEIKSRLDIVNLVSSYLPLKRAGRNYKGLCPFHNEKTPSFVVFEDSQSWRCFGQCGEGGDIFSFVMKMEGWSFGEALRELAKRAGVEIKETQPSHSEAEDQQRQRMYTLLDETARFFHEALPGSPAEDYLYQRGLTPETAVAFKIGYAPDEWNAALDHLTALGFSVEEVIAAGVAIHNEERGRVYDRFRHRFVIPIRDSKGRTIGFGARALSGDQEPKYLNSPQSELFDKSRTLFGFDMARRAIRESETAIIVEGYMDVIQAHQAGYHNVVASMGTALTRDHLQLVSKYAGCLVLALDADAAGLKATMRGLDVAREELGDNQTYVLDASGMMRQAGKLKLDIRVLHLPYGKDPDDFIRATPDRWGEQVESALPLAEYLIQAATANLPANASVAEREAIAHDLLPLLMATENNIQQHANIQRLSLRLHLDEKTMLEWAMRYVRHTPASTSSQKRSGKPHARNGGAASAPSTPVVTDASRGRVLEGHCLAILLREPHRLFEANRLLRGLRNPTDGSPGVPLQPDDFTQSEFKAIFALLQVACRQDELEPLSYLLNHIDPVLRPTIDTLLPEPLDIYVQHEQKRNVTELHSIQREQQRFPRRKADDFYPRLLTLRYERIQRESKELYFMLEEAQKEGDTALAESCTIQFSQINQALRVVDAARRDLGSWRTAQ
jgi:DNA primase